MAILTFKHGKNITDTVPFSAGTIYLDTETGEMWYDSPDPLNVTKVHEKIIDTDTLVYSIDETVEYESNELDIAKLGSGLLNYMKL